MILNLETSVPSNYFLKFIYLSFTRFFIPLTDNLFTKSMLDNNYLEKIDEKFIKGEESISIIEKFKFNRLKSSI